MTYTVLARRYRSRSFDEVVGQEAIVATLRAAVAAGRVAHAYLFTGTRGVGKTTTARLLANALNNPDDQPVLRDAIMSGSDTDVIEIDAASHTSVENARELIANCVYRPLRGRWKIYIIDEAHMLSMQAFNALLKTMEEPPAHVVFILCTTEPHKVPATIQSRCQRFDFRTIPVDLVARHLARVVEGEGLTAEPELLHALARLGDGSMRDALSLLDRVMAAGEPHLTLALLERLLGLPPRDTVGALVEALASRDVAGTLASADRLLGQGVSAEQLLQTLADRLRDLMVLAACGPETELVALHGAERTREAERAAKFDVATLSHMIVLCENVQRSLRASACPRALLDALLVRLALTERMAEIVSLLDRARTRAAASDGAETAHARAEEGAPLTPVVARGVAGPKKR